ncbi:hypothetical protein ACLKA7_000759 [Drosophila subpalustris]
MPAGGAPDQQGLTCLSRWRAVSSLRRQFWRRWSKEYILGLQAKSKWHHRTLDVVVGVLVVVAEDNLPPQKWLIGRVTAVHRTMGDKQKLNNRVHWVDPGVPTLPEAEQLIASLMPASWPDWPISACVGCHVSPPPFYKKKLAGHHFNFRYKFNRRTATKARQNS